jgi:prefoldin subunit 5
MKSLKQFKREIKALGYKVRTYTYSASNMRFLEVLDQKKEFIVGSGANVYGKAHIEKHRKIFDLLARNKKKIFELDKNGKIIAQVSF